jgi:hypothetical protein
MCDEGVQGASQAGQLSRGNVNVEVTEEFQAKTWVEDASNLDSTQ